MASVARLFIWSRITRRAPFLEYLHNYKSWLLSSWLRIKSFYFPSEKKKLMMITVDIRSYQKKSKENGRKQKLTAEKCQNWDKDNSNLQLFSVCISFRQLSTVVSNYKQFSSVNNSYVLFSEKEATLISE